MTISCIIITCNESKNIRRCLESVKWADEIVVVDSNSTDDTKKIASEFTDKIFNLDWGGFGAAKEFAKNQARGEWILSVDADEVVKQELKEEILKVINSADPQDGYFIPRRSNFLGRWMKHGGWYPDLVLRLFKKQKGQFTSRLVHEKVIVDGRTGNLKNDLWHYTDPDLDRYLVKMNRYTSIDALQRLKEDKTSSPIDLLIRPVATFTKMYFFKMGFLDGMAGLILAVSSAFHVFVKYAKLWHLNQSSIEENQKKILKGKKGCRSYRDDIV
jgi:glycosyltransferase involved in cell wall biosynthesis